jgi:hypothetical protein
MTVGRTEVPLDRPVNQAKPDLRPTRTIDVGDDRIDKGKRRGRIKKTGRPGA